MSVWTKHHDDAERERMLSRVDEAAKPLVAALERHRTDHGRYPAELSALVPEYLSELPATDWSRHPTYSYSVSETEFALRVACPGTLLDFDSFEYAPRDISDTSWARARAGDWVWVDD